MNGRRVVLALSSLLLVGVVVAVIAVLPADENDGRQPTMGSGSADVDAPETPDDGDPGPDVGNVVPPAGAAKLGGDEGPHARERERVDPTHGWQAAREIVTDPGRWASASDQDRKRVASIVQRRFPDMQFAELRTYSSGGRSHSVPVFKHRVIGMEFVLVSGGTFRMGSPTSEPGRNVLENEHTVTVSPFLIARTELTQAAWKRVFEFVPAHFEGDDLPLERVSHTQATRYCERMGLRLPTEAEWEFACRGGSRSAWSFGDASADVAKHAWFAGNAGRRTRPVAQKAPNAFGLHDMHGNVWEWCADFHGAYPTEPQTDPRGPEAGSHRVIRGGSWWDKTLDVRSATRSRYQKPEFNIGFRPALSLD